MILAVSLNPALDVTHHVPGVDWSGVNRPRQVTVTPGGKALNVARTLRALGGEVLVIGLTGGVTGEAVQAGLTGSGIPGRFIPIAGETRRTFAVVDTRSHDAALFNEPGPAISDGEYREFLVLHDDALAGCEAVVLSGSLPPGLPPDTYAGLAARAAWPCRAAVTRWPNWSWCSGWPPRWRGPAAWTPTGRVTSTGRSS